MIEQFINETRFRLLNLLDQRKPSDGLIGIPAFFALLVLGFMIVNSREAADGEHVKKLEREAQSLLDQENFAAARIAAMRLTQNETQGQKATLIEAKALRGMGREPEALRLLSRLAPLDRPGNATAHVLQSVILLAQKSPDIKTAQQHLDNALSSDPAHQDALELAARIAAGRRDWATVLQQLGKLDLEQRPDLLLMQATALQFSGQTEQGVKVASQAEIALRELHKSMPDGNEHVRFSIAASLSLQHQFAQAVQWMLDTLHGSPTKEERQVIGGIYLTWSRYLKMQPAADQVQIMELLEKGIQISPESQDLIMAFLSDCEELPLNGSERMQHVGEVLNHGGIATSFIHYYQGVQQWKQGSKDAARVHFDLACSLNPSFGVISNNLAMAIAAVSDDKSELGKALVMMDQLVKQEPENPFFLDTRAHVFAKLGQLHEAVRDLEYSLAKARNKQGAHLQLVELYNRLGMPEQAAQHQSMLVAEQALH